MHRPIFIGAVSVGTFITALVALVVVPQQGRRAAQAIAPKPGERPDTMVLVQAVATANARVASSELALSAARTKAAMIAQAQADTLLDPVLATRRDSLNQRLAALEALLARTETAPLAASYRALGESRELAAHPAVKALLDSLTDIERERDASATSGGADPVFVALTARATEIGHALQTIGVARRDSLSNAIAILAAPVRPKASELVQADTARRIVARDSATAAVAAGTAQLEAARLRLEELDRRAERARVLANPLNAPPYAMLASAIVFGMVLGFGAALAQELRHPRIADAREAERVGGVRVISVIRPRPPSPERGRRMADRVAPPHIDPGNDAHQLVWLFVAPPASSLLMLTISGESSLIAAIVAANLGAVAAEEARNVIVIDTDERLSPVSSALRMNPRPGLQDILEGRVSWPEATRHATIGRDRVIDVVPSGVGHTSPDARQVSDLLRRDAARMARHYDTVLVTASRELTLSGLPGALPMHDVIYCARLGYTRHSDLKEAMQGIRLAGGNPLGIVLWDDFDPAPIAPAEIAAGVPPQRTAEMEALVGGRAR
jgi:Mrp family chromosome partitioning ATPase/mRNA-degrading endonuclease toxin of MazEF toxin-antitoxin module